MIKEQIARINESLRQIDYNAGRYIILETQPSLEEYRARKAELER